MFQIARITGALLGRRILLYSVVAAAAILAEFLLVRAIRGHQGELFANAIALPIVTTIVYAFTNADARKKKAGRAIWSLVLERAWAVIAIDYVISYVSIVANTVAIDGLAGLFVGSLGMLLVASLLLVDVAAVVEPEPKWFLLLPHAFTRGVTLAWTRGTLIRCLVIYVLQFAVAFAAFGVQFALGRLGTPDPSFWANLALTTILAIPICVFSAVVYFDAAGVGIATLAADDTVE